MGQVLIFDTTLRDGLKSPGAVLTLEEKVRLAKQLARLKVDVLEAGFPAASEEQFAACERIAGEVSGPVIAVLARATNPRDFEIAWQAVKAAARPRLHTFIPASPQYRGHFLKKDAASALALGVSAIRMAKQFAADVELSLLDAFRADEGELIELIRGAAEAGAGTVNLADTVGRTTPNEVLRLFKRIRAEVDGPGGIALSIHCHNDLGMAVANSLAAVFEGATQVHCTVNGIGERAGNTPTEELIAALVGRPNQFKAQIGIRLDQIYPTSRLVRRLTGIHVQPHKPVVGANAFILEPAGPQLGDASEIPPYDIIRPEKLGIEGAGEFLTAQAGREELAARIGELGYTLTEDELGACYASFHELAARKEKVFDADIELLASARKAGGAVPYKLLYLNVTAGSISVPNATVQLEVDGKAVQEAGFGHGPVDAAFQTICKIVKLRPRLARYEVGAVTPGADAQGQVSVQLELDGHFVTGRAVDMDIVLASAKAFVDGLNKLVSLESRPEISEFTDEEGWMPGL